MSNGTHYVYFLECTSEAGVKCYYTGYTSRTPSARLAEHIHNVKTHNTNHFTGRFRFVRLICYQSFDSEADAIKVEKIYKQLDHDGKAKIMDAIKKEAKRRRK